ncbi:MAG: outer membrane beta-barrel protein [Rariglobus sp.]|nr:outer membrane beta-barrel protein [Rariglobus sp.]
MIKFNEGRDQLFVSAGMSAAYDSNIFANSSNEEDIVTNFFLGIDYTRRAGMIGVDGSLSWDLGSFASNASEDFSNPSLNLEFTKNNGRTTGSLKLNASRESQADPNVNLRTDAWNYGADLSWKYPVIERYSLAGTFGYGLIDYVDNSAGLIDLSTYSAGLDLNYAYDSKRQIIAGYRIRQSETSSGNSSTDHSLTAGISGKIFAKITGSIRAGYQIRKDSATGETFGSMTASGDATWTVTKRLKITGSISKDFATTAIESGSDSLTFNLDAQYTLTSKWSVYSGLGLGHTDYISGPDINREDYFATWNSGIGYNLNTHFSTSLSYSYFKNWSNRSTSEFDRHSITLSASTRW